MGILWPNLDRYWMPPVLALCATCSPIKWEFKLGPGCSKIPPLTVSIPPVVPLPLAELNYSIPMPLSLRPAAEAPRLEEASVSPPAHFPEA